MPRSKQISEDLRRRVVEMHEGGNGYTNISKNLHVHRSTVRQIIYKWKKFSTVATLPRSGRPTKIAPRAQRALLKEVEMNPKRTAKDLQKSLELGNVHVSTIRKTLNKNGYYGKTRQGKSLLSKKTKKEEAAITQQ
ncbi:hypothetical protein LDENG_00140680 [Lucifuga dentata]|nr:hypothetical protein LDENG_00140680 [Lucifuga dentata]